VDNILLITPPFTQLNTPYPATAYIKGFLNTKSIPSFQVDLGMDVILELFSREGLTKVFSFGSHAQDYATRNSKRIHSLKENYINTITEVIAFLQGKRPSMARQFISHNFLPRASRFDQLDEIEWAFGTMGLQDKAKHYATLYLEDLSDYIVECVDEQFGFSRYAERLGRSANNFDQLYASLQEELSLIDHLTVSLLADHVEQQQPKLVCLSVPFPGNLFSAFRCAQYLKENHPEIKVAMGGGFPTTELRSVSDRRVFDYVDYISLDDGETPLEIIIANIMDPAPTNRHHGLYKRTFLLKDDQIEYNNYSLQRDYKHHEVGTPDYSDLRLKDYISVIQVANPMHSLWSDGRWNKLTMAHGCYWGKCTFCDISLPYIGDYAPAPAKLLVDRMEEMIAQTDEYGFHFVDEAAPPALMRDLAIEIIQRGLKVTWWTNIRFEKSFSFDLCRLLKASGCIAVSGGIEVASDRLLDLIEKGVTVEQVAQVTRNITEAGIMVHAYLMYGYPSQTEQETIDSLEMVRQLFQAGVVQSAFWHQFALTAHSPIGLDPDRYGITPKRKKITFADNDIEFEDSTAIDHEMYSQGLKKSLFNYMHDACFDYDLQEWFDFEIDPTTIDPYFIQECLDAIEHPKPHPHSKVIWMGSIPNDRDISVNERSSIITLHEIDQTIQVEMPNHHAQWLISWLPLMSVHSEKLITYQDLLDSYNLQFDKFDEFWNSEYIGILRLGGLIMV